MVDKANDVLMCDNNNTDANYHDHDLPFKYLFPVGVFCLNKKNSRTLIYERGRFVTQFRVK